ncbi:EH signature domain-containing protein [Phenylobacterium sp.]|uniref:EH signature domain-containing protein n=1 Tax=Phenylobacterium sp. TaxID=1871053 RepID=UPI002730EDEB|nr:EH signature domain-containing protein [Phenylobacterium sp.]MDP1598723.1 EH signature domain-containing protein [Phenylobacterium sp.]
MADNTEVIQLRIAAAVRDGSAGLNRLSRRDLREGCRVFLHPPQPPGRIHDVGAPLIEEVVRLQRRAAYLALIDAYLDGFAIDDPDVSRLAAALAATGRNWPWRSTDFWPQRVKIFRLFEPTEAPARLAAAVLNSEAPPRAILDSAGLHSEGRRKGGLAEAAFRTACVQAASKVGRPAVSMQERIVAWAQDGGGALAFPRAWPDFTAALFMPWRRDDPSASHRSLLIEAAVGYGGDPRVNESRWRPVRQSVGDAYDVIVRWLTKASVEQFFDIVSETMTDRPDMWEQRRKFWTAYLKADMISAAWVAFGADGALRASQAARRSSDSGLSMFGRLSSGGGRSSEHAALIMRIGDLTVVEWSHNGRWNIWRRSDSGAPGLFRHNSRGLPDYAPPDLMNAPMNGTHQGSWEWKLAETIRQETGLRP